MRLFASHVLSNQVQIEQMESYLSTCYFKVNDLNARLEKCLKSYGSSLLRTTTLGLLHDNFISAIILQLRFFIIQILLRKVITYFSYLSLHTE